MSWVKLWGQRGPAETVSGRLQDLMVENPCQIVLADKPFCVPMSCGSLLIFLVIIKHYVAFMLSYLLTCIFCSFTKDHKSTQAVLLLRNSSPPGPDMIPDQDANLVTGICQHCQQMEALYCMCLGLVFCRAPEAVQCLFESAKSWTGIYHLSLIHSHLLRTQCFPEASSTSCCSTGPAIL